MNKTKTARLERISRKCELNKTHIKDLIRWCEDYKKGKGDIGLIMGTFTLKYDDVAFVIENLDEIKAMTKKKRSLFEKPKYKKYAKIISFKSEEEAKKSASKIIKEFTDAKTNVKRLRLARVLQYASNRAMAMSKRKNLSIAKKNDYKKISKVYDYGADVLFELYNKHKK